MIEMKINVMYDYHKPIELCGLLICVFFFIYWSYLE